MKNIVLIGFMGTGKSCIGRLLASRLNRPFIDTDKKIELDCNMTIGEIFADYGENYFREKEKAVIAKVSKYTNAVIATGGGVVLFPENINRLKSTGILIALSASVEVILERTSRRNIRPLLNCHDREQRITKLLHDRVKLYNVADYSIDTSFGTPQEIVDTIMIFLRQGGHLRGRT